MKKLLATLLCALLILGMAGAVAEEKETLEFYHGYFHDESAWAPAKVMRDIYDEFAAMHADGPVTFKPIPVENAVDIMNNMVTGGSFPDVIDLAGSGLSLAAVAQNLVLDVKPYIDETGIQSKVGLNYTQNLVDGAIYSVHDQLLTLGFWYNEAIFAAADVAMPSEWKSWDDFSQAMQGIRDYGADKGIYAYGSGQGSNRCFNTALALTENGKAMLTDELSYETITSDEFAAAFKTVATLDQINGSAYSSTTANDFTADFNDQKSSVFFNGVWASGGFKDNTNFQPAVFPGSVAISAAGDGISISNQLSDDQKALALEFLKYMTSDEVQTKIFMSVGANPCNTDIDIQALADGSGDSGAMLLAKACSLANGADIIVTTVDNAWGSDIAQIINNKLIECAVGGVDIDAKLADLVDELTAIIE